MEKIRKDKASGCQSLIKRKSLQEEHSVTQNLVCNIHMCGGINMADLPVSLSSCKLRKKPQFIIQSQVQPNCQQMLTVLLYFDVTSMKLT